MKAAAEKKEEEEDIGEALSALGRIKAHTNLKQTFGSESPDINGSMMAIEASQNNLLIKFEEEEEKKESSPTVSSPSPLEKRKTSTGIITVKHNPNLKDDIEMFIGHAAR